MFRSVFGLISPRDGGTIVASFPLGHNHIYQSFRALDARCWGTQKTSFSDELLGFKYKECFPYLPNGVDTLTAV